MKILDRVADVIVDLAADATEGALCDRALQILIIPAAAIVFGAVLAFWHVATTRRAS